MGDVDEVHRTVEVDVVPERAFTLWHRRIDLWWPPGHRRSGLANAQMVLEPRVGGRLLERTPAGDEIVWGVVQTWDPPVRITHTFVPGSEGFGASLVTVTFEALASGRTRVRVRHGPGDLAPAPWSTAVARFEAGWRAILDAYTAFRDDDGIDAQTSQEDDPR